MKYLLFVLVLVCLANTLFAQNVYTINADSTKLTGCDSNELIIENHTQNVPGFLFNTGKGRTIFKRAVVKLNDSSYVIGGDTLRSNAWLQGGNRFGATGVLGTLDSNHLDFYTKNTRRGRWMSTGNLLIGTTTDNGEKFQVDGNATVNGPVVLGAKILIGDKLFNNVLGMRIYGDTLSGNTTTGSSHYAVMGLNILETQSLYNTAKQGGAVFMDDRSTVMPLRFIVRPTGTTLSAGVAGFTTTGNFLLNSILDSGYKLQVKGTSLFSDKVFITAGNGDGSGQLFFKNGAGEFTTFMGTTAYDMFFKTRNNTQKFQFQFGGPTNVLSLEGNSGGDIRINSPSNAIDLYNIKYLDGGSNNSVYLISNNYSNSDGVVVTRNTRSTVITDPIFTIKQSDTIVFDALKNGKIGVGTSTPSAQFHTTGSVRFAGLTNDSTQTRVIVSDASGNLYYRSASSLAANDILHSSLAVNGPVRARSLTLSQTGWPDYVFDSAYRLMPLQEVENYIQRNSHLPGVPSAAEISRDGLSVGDNQAVLMKKIEELTLYNIAQQKKIDEQEKRLARLEKELESVKKK